MAKPLFLTIALLWFAFALLVLLAGPLRADSARLLVDLEGISRKSNITNKASAVTSESAGTQFSQLYHIDIIKELSPNLMVNGGGLFNLEKTDYEFSDGVGTTTETTSKSRNIRPFAELRLTTPLLQAGTGYRKAEVKQSGTDVETTRKFTEEYSTMLMWKPVDLPRLNMNLTHSLAYDEPMTTDAVTDIFELRSRYAYQDFDFDYSHATNDFRQKYDGEDPQGDGFKTITNTDIGAVRYRHPFWDGKVAVSAGVRFSQIKADFSGAGARLTPTLAAGTSFYYDQVSDTFSPLSSTTLNLLADTPKQLSFGLDFGTATSLDTLYVNLLQASPENNQLSPSDIDTLDHLFSWSVFVSDDQETWTSVAVTAQFSAEENRFKLSLAGVETSYVKIVTTQKDRTSLGLNAAANIILSNLESLLTLPPETSEFSRTNLNTDLAANWKMSATTSSGYDLRYREDKSKTFDDKKSYLSAGANVNHVFTEVFSGRTMLSRTERRRQGELENTSYLYSAALAGRYLATFNQTLTYSYSNNKDEKAGRDTTNSVLLRNNMDLYAGWSMNLDNGYSWQYPKNGGKRTTTFARLASSISPNRWMHLTLAYGVSWATATAQRSSREQTGNVIAAWTPFSSLSMAADLFFVDRDNGQSDSMANRRYSVNWSPFRDGTLQFSFAYGGFRNSEDEKTDSLSSALKWQINHNSLLTVAYSLGEREDMDESGEFDTLTVSLRFFY